MPLTIEEIVDLLETLPSASGDMRHASALHGDRAYLARGPGDVPELFLRVDSSSFGEVDNTRAIEWGHYQVTTGSAPLPALVLRTRASADGRRLMAHVAYEVTRLLQQYPSISNALLIERIQPFLRLVSTNALLSPEEQIGLMGELQLLHEILVECDDVGLRTNALISWVGPSAARRDFFTNGIGIEVKSSSGQRHRVGMDQLLPSDDDDDLYLCSVKVRRDHSAPLRLPEQVGRVEAALLNPPLIEQFHSRLRNYGSLG